MDRRLDRRRLALVTAFCAALSLLASACGSGGSGGGSAEGPWEPTEPIEYIAPAGTGGGWDTLARTSARVLDETGLASQPLQVVNMPGAGGGIGWAHVAATPDDPHKLFVTSPPILLVPLAGEIEYDHTDFTPIARLATEYVAYMVPADSPLESFEDLVAALEEDPASVSVAGGSAPGSLDHVALAGALNAAGISPADVNYVPFDGGGEALTALIGGHVDAAVSGYSEAAGLVESGDVRVLAVSAPEPPDALPDVPVLADAGVDYTFDIWRGVMGPGGLTDEQVAYYEQVFADMVETDEWQAEIEQLGWIDDYQGSAEFGEFLDEKATEFAQVLTEVGLVG